MSNTIKKMVLQKAQATCNTWNTKHKVGTKVTITLHDGTTVQTETADDAYVLTDGTVPVILTGYRDIPYALKHISIGHNQPQTM